MRIHGEGCGCVTWELFDYKVCTIYDDPEGHERIPSNLRL